MILYIAVTCDRYELPLFVSESAEEMAAWMGIPRSSVYTLCSRSKNKPPYQVERSMQIRLRKVEVEDGKE